MFKAVFTYRHFILESIKREFLQKYTNSFLGALWAVLNPLSMIAIYTLVFSQIMKAKLPGIDSSFAYSIYLCAGIIPWALFVEISSRSVNVFMDNANFLKKIRMPKICFPIIIVGSACINFIITSVLFFVFLAVAGFLPGYVIFYSIPLVLAIIILSVSIGVFLGVLNVFFRDIGQFFNIFVQFLFWFTPIVYPVNIVPERFRFAIYYNPFTVIIDGFHSVFIDRAAPDFYAMSPLFIGIIVFALFTLYFFRKHSEEIIDEL